MTPTSAISKRHSGFTLLELLIVLAILAMGSALLIPNLGGMSGRTFNAQLREATALLNYTRRNAVVLGQPATARFFSANDGEGEQSEIEAARSDLGRDESWTARGIELSYRDSTDQTVLVEDRVEVTFFPEGGSTGGALMFSLDEREAVISIDPFSGKVRTEILDD